MCEFVHFFVQKHVCVCARIVCVCVCVCVYVCVKERGKRRD